MIQEKKSLRWLYLGIIFNTFFLLYFKYLNFFILSLNKVLHSFGVTSSLTILNIIIPLGISYVTFQQIGYLVDVYRGEFEKKVPLVNYLLYISFFPQILGGPIEKSTFILNQLISPLHVTRNKLEKGGMLILVGLFKKLVLSVPFLVITNSIFYDIGDYSILMIWIGAYLYGVFLYIDFSAYTNMARGLAYLFGIELTVNFRNPFISTNITDFFSRWHISLTEWFKNYVFYPLVFTSRKPWLSIFCTLILISLWHKASVGWLLFGLYCFMTFVFHYFFKKFVFIYRRSVFDKIISIMFFNIVTMPIAWFLIQPNLMTNFESLNFTLNFDMFVRDIVRLKSIHESDFQIVLMFLPILLCFQILRQRKTFDEWYQERTIISKALVINMLLLGLLLFAGKADSSYVYFSY